MIASPLAEVGINPARPARTPTQLMSAVLDALLAALGQGSSDGSPLHCSSLLDGSVLLTVDNVAAWIDMSRSATYELILTGAIRSVKVGRSRRVPVVAVRDFVAQQLSES